MSQFLKTELESLGVKVTLVDLGRQMLDGQDIALPPAVLGEIGNDPKKKTVALYAHYDVQPVSSSSSIV
jgi:Cys-Gly metallodipeptidase DUG1